MYEYKKIKNNYCIYYYGFDLSIIFLLDKIKNIIEQKYNEIKIYIALNDEYEKFFYDKDYFIKRSEIINEKKFIACKEIINKSDLEKFLKESEIIIS